MRDPIPSTALLKEIPAFEGFPIEGRRFLAGLALNNDKVWFDAHRDEYEQYLLAPMRSLVLEIGTRLRKSVPGITADPRVGGSIMRIARDIRFAADKSPYKTWVAARWWEGQDREQSAAFYFHIDAESTYAGGGIYQFDDDQLTRYRAALNEPKALAALKRALKGLEDLEIGGSTLKRPPRGFTPDHPAGDLMLHKGFYAGRDLPPRAAKSAQVIDEAVTVYKQLLPFNRWLMTHVVHPFRP